MQVQGTTTHSSLYIAPRSPDTATLEVSVHVGDKIEMSASLASMSAGHFAEGDAAGIVPSAALFLPFRYLVGRETWIHDAGLSKIEVRADSLFESQM